MRFILVSIDNDLTESVLAVIGKDNAIRFPTVPRMCSAGFGGDGIIITGVSGPGRVNAATRLGCRNMIAVYPSRGKRMPPVRKENGVVYLGAPFTKEDLSIAVAETDSCFSVAAAIRKQLAGSSAIMEKTRQLVEKAIYSNLPVHLIGETGTGKELFAHAVHNASPRSNGPFVALNCAAMPENLLESELFGYEDGAFTGARRGGKPGMFEFAHGGTLFLDEVEGMSPALQIKLLRVLQEREIMRVGGNQIISVNVRIVAATNEDLEQRVEEGSFRRDLYYRLNTLPVLIPPLRERDEDLFLLIENFQTRLGARFRLSEEVRALLASHQWRGNIRELRNVVEYFSCTGNAVICPEDLPPTFRYCPLREERPAPVRPAAAPEPAAVQAGSEEARRFVLHRLLLAAESGAGRDSLLRAAHEEGISFSQLEVRHALASLSREGLVQVSRGRGGTDCGRPAEQGVLLCHGGTAAGCNGFHSGPGSRGPGPAVRSAGRV